MATLDNQLYEVAVQEAMRSKSAAGAPEEPAPRDDAARDDLCLVFRRAHHHLPVEQPAVHQSTLDVVAVRWSSSVFGSVTLSIRASASAGLGRARVPLESRGAGPVDYLALARCGERVSSDFSALLSNAYHDRRSRRGTRGGLSELRRRDELLTAIDVVRRTSERSVGHDVHSQRSHIGRPDHAANWERGPQLLAPGVEPVTEKIG